MGNCHVYIKQKLMGDHVAMFTKPWGLDKTNCNWGGTSRLGPSHYSDWQLDKQGRLKFCHIPPLPFHPTCNFWIISVSLVFLYLQLNMQPKYITIEQELLSDYSRKCVWFFVIASPWSHYLAIHLLTLELNQIKEFICVRLYQSYLKLSFFTYFLSYFLWHSCVECLYQW